MKRLFTVVPPPPSSSSAATAVGVASSSSAEAGRPGTATATVGAHLRQQASGSHPPPASASAPSGGARSGAASTLPTAGVGGALDGLRGSLDLGSLPSWLGGSGAAVTAPKGKARVADGGDVDSRSSFDDAPDPLLRSMPTAAAGSRSSVSSSTTPQQRLPPSLLSSFPTFGRTSSPPTASALSDQLLEALEEPLSSALSTGPSAAPPPTRSKSSSDVPAALPSLYAQASTSQVFIPPLPPAPPPQAHIDSPDAFAPAAAAAAPTHARQTSFSQRSATALATSSFFNPHASSASRTPSPTGFGGPYLQRSATLSSIDSLRHVQRQQSLGGSGGGGQQVRPISSGSGWWKEHKAMVDGMLKDEDKADTVEGEEDVIARRHQAPKNPVVFCHGLFGFDHLGPASLPALQISHWRGIKEVLEGNQTEVYIARVPATSSIEERARTLQSHLEEHFAGRTVNLIGHSMVRLRPGLTWLVFGRPVRDAEPPLPVGCAGRPRLPLPHLEAQAVQLQGREPDDDRDAPPRLGVCRPPDRRHHRQCVPALAPLLPLVSRAADPRRLRARPAQRPTCRRSCRCST